MSTRRADGKLLASRTQAPWSARWKLKGVPDGAHVLRAVATSAAGKTAEARRTVTVQRTDAPAPIQLPYAVRGISASPAESFGSTPIRIRDEAISSGGGNGASGQPVPDHRQIKSRLFYRQTVGLIVRHRNV